jgi:glutamate/tyrosine decarboxylase-like PLP-dependent enzyme
MEPDDPLAMDPEAMRRLGYEVVDRLVVRAERMDASPALRTSPRRTIAKLLDEPPPERPQPVDQVLDELFENVLPFLGRFDHPRFFAYVPGAGTWPAALADLVASAANIDAGEWREAAGPSQVELTVLGWFAEWIGYPSGAEGILVSGGSAANLQGLAVAREALAGPMSDRIVVYVGDVAHSSIARGARALGFRPEQVRVLPTDERFRLRAATAAAAMDADRREGRLPLAVVAAGGATNTGAVDPFVELAELCRERNVWLHVDAAYGGFAVLTERGRRQLDGLELADSVTLDPHKWLAMPFEVGCLMVREGHQLRSAFEIVPEYLKDTQLMEAEVNLANRGLQLTRGARALKVWMSLKVFGVDAFRRAIDRSLDLAVFAQECIERSEHLEIVTPVTLGVLTFRRRFPGISDEDELERLNARLIRSLAESGVGLVSSTRLRGRYVIRFCVLNHTSGKQDVLRVLDWLDSADVPTDRDPMPAVERASETGIRQSWLAGPTMTPEDLVAIPLFQTLTEDRCVSLLAVSQEQRLAPGEIVIREWEYGKLFFVVLEGAMDVLSGDQVIGVLQAGDFFGENAALDWGAGYSYARTASVRAREPARLLVIPGAVLDDLRRTGADVERRLLAAIRERLGSRWPSLPAT